MARLLNSKEKLIKGPCSSDDGFGKIYIITSTSLREGCQRPNIETRQLFGTDERFEFTATIFAPIPEFESQWSSRRRTSVNISNQPASFPRGLQFQVPKYTRVNESTKLHCAIFFPVTHGFSKLHSIIVMLICSISKMPFRLFYSRDLRRSVYYTEAPISTFI